MRWFDVCVSYGLTLKQSFTCDYLLPMLRGAPISLVEKNVPYGGHVGSLAVLPCPGSLKYWFGCALSYL